MTNTKVRLHTLHPILRVSDAQMADYFAFLTNTSQWRYVAENVDTIQLFGEYTAS